MIRFEERREEYFNNLRSNPLLLVKLFEKEENKNSKIMEIMIRPKTEGELNLAESVWVLMSDFITLTEDAMNNRIKKVEPGDSVAVNTLIELVNSFKTNDDEKVEEIKLWLSNISDPKEIAKIIYDLMAGFMGDPSGTFDYITSKCDVNDNDKLSLLQFQLYLGKANDVLNDKTNNTVDLSTIDINNLDKVTQVIQISEEFHRLCEEGKSINKDYTKRK